MLARVKKKAEARRTTNSDWKTNARFNRFFSLIRTRTAPLSLILSLILSLSPPPPASSFCSSYNSLSTLILYPLDYYYLGYLFYKGYYFCRRRQMETMRCSFYIGIYSYLVVSIDTYSENTSKQCRHNTCIRVLYVYVFRYWYNYLRLYKSGIRIVIPFYHHLHSLFSDSIQKDSRLRK